mgnify:CR=1 FL=1
MKQFGLMIYAKKKPRSFVQTMIKIFFILAQLNILTVTIYQTRYYRGVVFLAKTFHLQEIWEVSLILEAVLYGSGYVSWMNSPKNL